MHELGIARALCDQVCAAAEGGRVTRVRVEVGALSGVVPEALGLAFECASQDTVADGAELLVERVPGRGDCRDCGTRFELWDPWQSCRCGSLCVSWEGGDTLRLTSVEVQTCAEPVGAPIRPRP